jgi:hypothetical protein
MADGEIWLTRDVAIERLRRFLKFSVGAAEAAFDQAMSSGTIRSRTFTTLIGEPDLERLVFEDRLEPEVWKRGDHRSINGEVSSDDLEFWVAQQLALSPGDPPQTLPRDTAEEACRKLIVSLDDSTLTKADIHARAIVEIPDLTPAEFKRAWRRGANLLKRRGRRTASN